jgi:hypothetical protein
MPITQTQTTSFKEELYEAVHNFNTDVFKIALYTSSADLGPNTTVYTTVGEVATGGGYTAGGKTLTGATISTGFGTAYISFNTPVTWPGATFTARGALIYNSSKGNKAVAVYNFGQDQNAGVANSFNVNMPANTAQEALIRMS